jgi:hypothetical protein
MGRSYLCARHRAPVRGISPQRRSDLEFDTAFFAGDDRFILFFCFRAGEVFSVRHSEAKNILICGVGAEIELSARGAAQFMRQNVGLSTLAMSRPAMRCT